MVGLKPTGRRARLWHLQTKEQQVDSGGPHCFFVVEQEYCGVEQSSFAFCSGEGRRKERHGGGLFGSVSQKSVRVCT